MDEILEDQRFAHIPKDPRYRQMKRGERKVKIDTRFQSMFKDKRFKLKYTVDKRGRPVHTTTNENLRKYYDLSTSSSEEEDDKQSNQSESDPDSESDDHKKGKAPIKKKQAGKRSRKAGTCSEGSNSVAGTRVHSSTDERLPHRARPSTKSRAKTGKAVSEKRSLKTRRDEQVEESESSDEDLSSGSDTAGEDENESSGYMEVGGGPDYARGEALMASSSDDDDDESDEDEEEGMCHAWGELDKAAPVAEEVTHRLAVCNMDWDRIKANDLLVLFNSFKPAGGIIHSVTIYPSEYGQQRIAQEAQCGPTEIVEQRLSDSEDSADAAEEKHQREKLRQYQLNRLKYYYAVVECDSPNTANHIYEQCDGIEYESSATKVDLRFIPNDMMFDQEAKSIAKDVPDVAVYKPTLFANTALQQSKVDLTWDETDPDRLSVTMRKFTEDEIEQMDFEAYLASDSENSEDPYGDIEDPSFGQAPDAERSSDNEEEKVEKYRQLLLGSLPADRSYKTRKSNDGDKEIDEAFGHGLKGSTEGLMKKSPKKKERYSLSEDGLKAKKKKKKEKGKNQEKETGDDQVDRDASTLSDDELPADACLNDAHFQEESDVPEGKSARKKRKEKKSQQKKKEDGKKRSDIMEDEGVEDPVLRLASDADSNDDEEEEEQIQQYRQLVLASSAKSKSRMAGDKDMDMEITWDPGLKETTEGLVKKASRKKEGQTPWEEYLEKKKEKKKRKKEEKEKSQQRKETGHVQVDRDPSLLSDDDLPADVCLDDPYFQEEIDALEGKSAKKKLKRKRMSKQEPEEGWQKDSGNIEDEAELALLLHDEDDQKQHFSLKAIMQQENQTGKKRKKKMKKKKDAEAELAAAQDTFQVNVEDSRFSALYEDPRYHIDPSAPEFKKTKGMEAFIEESQRRWLQKQEGSKKSAAATAEGGDSPVPVKKQRTEESEKSGKTLSMGPELANLVKSVKANTRAWQERRKKK